MSTREPSSESILAARIQRAYPALNPYQSASLARDLCAIERAQRRHAERCCSGSDGGYVQTGSRTVRDHYGNESTILLPVHDPAAEERAEHAIGRRMLFWHSHLLEHANYSGGVLYHADDANKTSFANPGDVAMRTEGDPRGAVLLVQFPGETEARSV